MLTLKSSGQVAGQSVGFGTRHVIAGMARLPDAEIN